ncbi:mRNA interferase EndoA [Enterococcus faecalis EnGen0370]|nr:mRNA interferase EndoA [Enterococcus faecalis EnGen0370]
MIKRGEVFYANLSPVVGSEQGGIRPVLIIQNNKGNLFSPTLIVAPIVT